MRNPRQAEGSIAAAARESSSRHLEDCVSEIIFVVSKRDITPRLRQHSLCTALLMNYKGYSATVEYEPDDRVFHGRVNDISDVVSFEGTSVDELEAAFHNSVEQYVAFCEEQGRAPQRPYSGRFLMRVPAELHRRAAEAAARAGESMNAWVQGAIEHRLAEIAPTSAKKKLPTSST